jgi:hypothetical protein
MATFSQWLAGHEAGAQDDPVAWLARQWKALEGNRPRVSSPSGIEKHLMTLAAGEPAQQDQWTGYVHTAVAEATSRYKQAKAAEQSGSDTSSSAVLPGTGTNPATGKPVAVVGQAQWKSYPDASQYGSCYICGWARGLADVGAGEQLMCAAAHVFEPQKPGPIGEAGPTDPQTGETTITLSGPLTPSSGLGGSGRTYDPSADAPDSVQLAPGAHSAVLGGQGAGADLTAAGYVHEDDAQPVDLLALVNPKLTVLMVTMGLPTDPSQLAELLLAAAEQQQQEATDSLASQLAEAGMRAAAGEPRAIPPEPGSQASGQPVQPWNTGMPPGFAAWYGVADPSATDE